MFLIFFECLFVIRFFCIFYFFVFVVYFFVYLMDEWIYYWIIFGCKIYNSKGFIIIYFIFKNDLMVNLFICWMNGKVNDENEKVKSIKRFNNEWIFKKD